MGADAGIVAEYDALRAESEADLLAMQVGDFYEFFGDDAEIVHEHLDLKLSKKPSGGTHHPMAGVPVSEIDRYAQALTERGFRLAIATQQESSNGHERAIDRIVTPGTTLERSDDGAGYLGVIELEGATIGLALIDVAAGQWYADRPHAAEDIDALLEVIGGLELAEVVVSPRIDDIDIIEQHLGVTVSQPTADLFDHRSALERVSDHFGSEVIDALELEVVTARAVGAALAYVEETDPSLLDAVTRLQRYRDDDAVSLDATTQRNLELTETFRGDSEGSLIDTIDHTVSAAGGRMLREWLQRPTRETDRLEQRLDAIDALRATPLAREALVEELASIYDLDRLATRCVHGSATPADLAKIRETLSSIPILQERIEASEELTDTPVAGLLSDLPQDTLEELTETLTEALVDDPPTTSTEGGIFRTGWDDDLDELIEEHERIAAWFDELADREADRHGFDQVTVDDNQTDGYYIQVSEADAEDVPSEYDRIKSVAAGVRFRTDELAENERRFREFDERRSTLEEEAFESLRAGVGDEVRALRAAAQALAGLDVRIALADHAVHNDWVRPAFRSDGVIEIDQGRHPVVEQTTRFVPNDSRIDDSHRQLLVTGPNMSGKSTYLRQVALITLLGQIGSFVPADRAAITPVDGIYTRVGALDELAQGRSTFMVEMQELARILHRATERSLVVLDEVGRGTSTYDGMSIAWATTEYLHNEVGAAALFATHYHELTALGEHLEGVANCHVAVDDSGDDVVFLRTVESGATDRSYGIHVADLAGVPLPVVQRADEVLARLREDKAIEARGRRSEGTQVVFDLESGDMHPDTVEERNELDEAMESILEELRSLSLDTTAPLDVVEVVNRWQERLEDD